jgi:hypothetical protein
MTGRRSRVALALVLLTTVLSVAWAGTAEAAVTVPRAEVSGDRLRIEGRATHGPRPRRVRQHSHQDLHPDCESGESAGDHKRHRPTQRRHRGSRI